MVFWNFEHIEVQSSKLIACLAKFIKSTYLDNYFFSKVLFKKILSVRCNYYLSNKFKNALLNSNQYSTKLLIAFNYIFLKSSFLKSAFREKLLFQLMKNHFCYFQKHLLSSKSLVKHLNVLKQTLLRKNKCFKIKLSLDKWTISDSCGILLILSREKYLMLRLVFFHDFFNQFSQFIREFVGENWNFINLNLVFEENL